MKKKMQPKLIGPPKTAANEYVRLRMMGNCRWCEECNGPWSYVGARNSAGVLAINAGGRIMAFRKAMYIASKPEMKIMKGFMVTSKCFNPNCINPEFLVQATRSAVLKSHYEKGIRSKKQAVAHLIAIRKTAAKVTPEIRLAILSDNRKGTEAASEYDITPSYYNQIQRGARGSITGIFAGLGARA